MSWVRSPLAAPRLLSFISNKIRFPPLARRAISYNPGVALNLYRRDRRDCKGGHSEDHLSSEFDERKKGWKRCECPIIVSGTLRRKFKRKTTGQWEWDAARAISRQLEGLADGMQSHMRQHPSKLLRSESQQRMRLTHSLHAARTGRSSLLPLPNARPLRTNSSNFVNNTVTVISTNSLSPTWTGFMPLGKMAFAEKQRNWNASRDSSSSAENGTGWKSILPKIWKHPKDHPLPSQNRPTPTKN